MTSLLGHCRLPSLLALAALLALSAEARAADSLRTSTDPAFFTFFERFREAVTLDDRDSVVSMTKLPILLNGENQDGKGFLAQFDWLFTSAEKACFASETPVPDTDGSFSLFCGELIFVFQKAGDSYRFTDIGAND